MDRKECITIAWVKEQKLTYILKWLKVGLSPLLDLKNENSSWFNSKESVMVRKIIALSFLMQLYCEQSAEKGYFAILLRKFHSILKEHFSSDSFDAYLKIGFVGLEDLPIIDIDKAQDETSVELIRIVPLHSLSRALPDGVDEPFDGCNPDKMTRKQAIRIIEHFNNYLKNNYIKPKTFTGNNGFFWFSYGKYLNELVRQENANLIRDNLGLFYMTNPTHLVAVPFKKNAVTASKKPTWFEGGPNSCFLTSDHKFTAGRCRKLPELTTQGGPELVHETIDWPAPAKFTGTTNEMLYPKNETIFPQYAKWIVDELKRKFGKNGFKGDLDILLNYN